MGITQQINEQMAEDLTEQLLDDPSFRESIKRFIRGDFECRHSDLHTELEIVLSGAINAYRGKSIDAMDARKEYL